MWEAVVWSISAAQEKQGIFFWCETLCPCSCETCLQDAARQNIALLRCELTVLLLAVNFTCDSVNGILSLPLSASVSSTSYLSLQHFVPAFSWLDSPVQQGDVYKHVCVYVCKYGVVFAWPRSWISLWMTWQAWEKRQERRGWDCTEESLGGAAHACLFSCHCNHYVSCKSRWSCYVFSVFCSLDIASLLRECFLKKGCWSWNFTSGKKIKVRHVYF